MIGERLKTKADALGEKRVAKLCAQLMTQELPPGVGIERTEGGIRLTGRNLRRRIIDDPHLRNFGR